MAIFNKSYWLCNIVIFLTVSLFEYIYAQECPEMEDKVVDLKGFDHLGYTFPCMYSGFVQVHQQTDSSLYYWFFRDESLSDTAPLFIWLNGGPGASSQIGNLMELGPLKLVRTGSGDIQVHSLTGQAWTEAANIIFLDQPVGVGYSFGDQVYTSEQQVRENSIAFIKGFYQKHPEMRNRDLYVTGESYGGKYQPNIADAFLEYNKDNAETDQIPLKGIIVGNGYVDPYTQRMHARTLSLALGTVQFEYIPQLDILEKRCEEATRANLTEAPKVCAQINSYITTVDGGMDRYDARYPATNSSTQEADLEEYLNDPEVCDQLHVSELSTKERKYAYKNHTVYDNLLSDGMKSYTSLYDKLLEQGLPILLFVGNLDRIDGPVGVQEWMNELQWQYMPDFHSDPGSIYYYKRDGDDKLTVGGNFRQFKNLHYLTIYTAGHLVPSTQLAMSRSMIKDMISSQKLLCHADDPLSCRLDKISCYYMKNCSENGQCINGKCHCDEGFYGADCSIKPDILKTSALRLTPETWAHYTWNSTEDFEVSIIGGNTILEVFAMEGEIPTRDLHNLYHSGHDVKFIVKGTERTHFISIFNKDPHQVSDYEIHAAPVGDYPHWLLWTSIGLGAAVITLAGVNFFLIAFR
ncbi:unnamed protein product [Moneuplotes crassus]|uniref:Carboxypeptidase n=1 Tax=Euplotes crassus TaxID=5936 RepID=A0AAD1U3C3_EUPCR|nr:unnamed protein product [Moneuplotes crassus]